MIRFATYDKVTGRMLSTHLSSNPARLQQIETEEVGTIPIVEGVSDATHRVERVGPFLKQREVVRKDAGNAATSR